MRAALTMLALLATGPVAWAEYQVGDVIVVVELAPLKDEGRVVDNVQPGFTLTVLRVERERLWVESLAAGWLDRAHVIPLEGAVKHFTDLIHEEPLDANRWQGRAKVNVASGDYDAAIEDLGEAIFLVPTWPGFYGDRGHAHLAKGDYDRAVADYGKAIEFAPDNPLGYCSRGVAFALKGRYALAKADYEEAHRLNRDYAEPLRNLAQLLACCPQAKWRDGEKAVKYATRACELSKCRSPRGLHLLACAHAEAGNHAEAIRQEQKAIERTPPASKRNRKIMHAALTRFESGQPYHELTRFE